MSEMISLEYACLNNEWTTYIEYYKKKNKGNIYEIIFQFDMGSIFLWS